MPTNLKTVDALKTALADSYLLYLKTQNYHWNVEGPHFPALHALFMQHYTDLALAIDEIAERIRALGEKAPGTYAQYVKLSALKEGNENAGAEEMVRDLLKSNETVVATLKRLEEAAAREDDGASEDIAIGRQQIHQKNAWMLAAFLK